MNEISFDKLQNKIKLCKRKRKGPEFYNPGTKYLYKSLYLKLKAEKVVCFGDLDYSKFELGDLDELKEWFQSGEGDIDKLSRINNQLNNAIPIIRHSNFV